MTDVNFLQYGSNALRLQQTGADGLSFLASNGYFLGFLIAFFIVLIFALVIIFLFLKVVKQGGQWFK